jgi:hypothetical protein
MSFPWLRTHYHRHLAVRNEIPLIYKFLKCISQKKNGFRSKKKGQDAHPRASLSTYAKFQLSKSLDFGVGALVDNSTRILNQYQ